MPISPYIHNLRQKVGHDLLHIPSVTILVFDEQNRVLLVKDAGSGQWTTPGGAIDPGERPATAALREMHEETNLRVELTHITGIYGGSDFIMTYPNNDQTSYFMTVFAARIVGGEMRPDQTETVAIAYFSQADLAALSLSPWKQLVLADAFQPQPQTRFQANRWRPAPDAVRTGGMSDYVRQIRAKVGNDRLMSTSRRGPLWLMKRVIFCYKNGRITGRWAPPAGAVEPHESTHPSHCARSVGRKQVLSSSPFVSWASTVGQNIFSPSPAAAMCWRHLASSFCAALLAVIPNRMALNLPLWLTSRPSHWTFCRSGGSDEWPMPYKTSPLPASSLP